jgi:hypothetical protein
LYFGHSSKQKDSHDNKDHCDDNSQCTHLTPSWLM